MKPAAPDDYGISSGAWFDIVRRARLSKGVYAAALTLGSYANADGTGIYCGTARLSLDLDCSYRTAQRYLAELSSIGLIERVRRVRRRGRSDEYRLIIAPDLLEHVDVPDPEKYRRMALDIRDQTRRGRRSRTGHLDGRYDDLYRTNGDTRTGHDNGRPSAIRSPSPHLGRHRPAAGSAQGRAQLPRLP